jgi:hypothetical protein
VVLSLLFALPGAATAADPNQPIFSTPCGFSHRAPDDPIVAPGEPGASHLHDFFGNVSTDASSTYESLRAAAATCRRSEDAAAYWVPTLFLDGQAVEPRMAQVYYLAPPRQRAAVRPHPAGLTVIAGNAHATGPQDTRVVSWHCGPDSGVDPQSTPPTCPGRHQLRLRVNFPDCWDGVHLDSADHKGHMAYPSRGACPASHPVRVPRIALNIRYPIAGGAGVSLSSGASHTAHADFFNTWDQGVLEHLVATCINASGNAAAPPCVPPRRSAMGLPELAVSTPTAVFGEAVRLAGIVSARAGAAVRIETERSGRWVELATTVTNASGVFEHRFEPGRSARYRAIGPDGGASAERIVRVEPLIRAVLRGRATVRRGARVVVSARSRPMKRTLVLRVERLTGGRWRLVERRSLRTRRGRASAALRFEQRGRHRVWVLSRADALHAGGESEPLALRIG